MFSKDSRAEVSEKASVANKKMTEPENTGSINEMPYQEKCRSSSMGEVWDSGQTLTSPK